MGHVGPGLGFFLIGLWHLFNHTKLHFLSPDKYRSRPWFPTSKIKHLELFLIMGGAALSIAMELFIGPDRHQPLDSDGTIPSNHLHNFEHAAISATFFAYAALAIALHRRQPPGEYALVQLLGAAAFGQQLFMFRLHSADHAGVEGQYHLLLQLVVAVSLVTTLLGVGLPASFPVGFVRSLSILFQGVWLAVMGFALWTPQLVPKGCFIHSEEGHQVVRCGGDESLHRAKALVNVLFSWIFIAAVVSAACFYLALQRIYGRAGAGEEYRSLMAGDECEKNDDVEAQKNNNRPGESESFVRMGKASRPDRIWHWGESALHGGRSHGRRTAERGEGRLRLGCKWIRQRRLRIAGVGVLDDGAQDWGFGAYAFRLGRTKRVVESGFRTGEATLGSGIERWSSVSSSFLWIRGWLLPPVWGWKYVIWKMVIVCVEI